MQKYKKSVDSSLSMVENYYLCTVFIKIGLKFSKRYERNRFSGR